MKFKDKKIRELLSAFKIKTIANLFMSLVILLTCSSSNSSKESSEDDILEISNPISYQQEQQLQEQHHQELQLQEYEVQEYQVYEIEPVIEEYIPTYEDKINTIIETYNLTIEQLDIILAGCVAEACDDGNNYFEGYAVANTLYNRIRSYKWVNYISYLLGEEAGASLYYQFIAPNQFTVYASEKYKNYLGKLDLPGYQAAIDMFYTEEIMHNYLSFRGNCVNVINKYETFNDNGNKYFNELTLEDTTNNKQILSRNKMEY